MFPRVKHIVFGLFILLTVAGWMPVSERRGPANARAARCAALSGTFGLMMLNRETCGRGAHLPTNIKVRRVAGRSMG